MSINIGIIISIYTAILALIVYIIKITIDYTNTKSKVNQALEEISELKKNQNTLIRLEENFKSLKEDINKIENKLDYLIDGGRGQK